MEFKEFRDGLTKRITDITRDVDHLFVADVPGDQLWEAYLSSFPAGTNGVFRERAEHDCSACRSFVKRFGAVVAVKDNKVRTIWDLQLGDTTYQPVANVLDKLVRSAVIQDKLVTKEATFGTASNKEILDSGKIVTWDHLHAHLPQKFITRLRMSETEDSVKSELRSIRNVFRRSLEEISLEALDVVLELISQNSLYKGEEWRAVLQKFREYHVAYSACPAEDRDAFTWEKSMSAGPVIGKIRNHSIGALLTQLSDGADIEDALRQYEAITAPANYKRPQAVFTQKMLEEARKVIDEMGYTQSLPRRFATLDDIRANNILFADRDAQRRIAGSVFDDMAKDVAVNPKQFERVESISVDRFLSDVLPTAKKMEVLVENKHVQNLVSLIAPVNADAPSMFKWGNGFSWAYTGNIADSMRERVKSAGGKVDGVLRFSIQWNTAGDNCNDFDAHCILPGGREIYYGSKVDLHSGGNLDVDIIDPRSSSYNLVNGVAVENITWPDLRKMPEGVYQFYVHNFNHRGGRSGFSAEIEFDGQIHQFEYPRELRNGERIAVARVHYSHKDGFSIAPALDSTTSSREAWGVRTNQFVPVSVVMFSPNYWDAQDGIGHRHVMFMLNQCVNPEKPNGFFNEYLQEVLLKNKRVFEALGSRMHVQDVQDQLSGLGFSTTKRASVVVRLTGATQRVLRVEF